MRCSRAGLALRYANRNPYFLWALLLFLLGLMFTFFSLSTAMRDVHLFFAGAMTQGAVKSKHMAVAPPRAVAAAALFAHGGKRGPLYVLRYEFTAAGRIFEGTMRVSQGEWNKARIGLPVEVVYLPSDPQVNRADEPFWGTGAMVPFGIGVAAWVGGICSAVAGARSVYRRVRLISHGAAALGFVNQVEIGQGRKGRSFIRFLKYTFVTENGGEKRLHEARMRWTVPFEPGEVHQGDVVLVAYDPGDPCCHEIDIFDARREDRLRLLAAAAR
jgi:hypothetical protein